MKFWWKKPKEVNRYPMCMDMETQYCSNVRPSQLGLLIECNQYWNHTVYNFNFCTFIEIFSWLKIQSILVNVTCILKMNVYFLVLFEVFGKWQIGQVGWLLGLIVLLYIKVFHILADFFSYFFECRREGFWNLSL